MGKFNTTKTKKTRTSNKAGGTAFRMSAKQELVHAVLTTFLEDKYYESGDERLERIKKLVAECEPKFVANLAVVARLEFNMRSVSHVLVGELSQIHNGDSLVKDTIVAVAIRPDDCLEIASYVGLPLPKQVKRGLRNAILKYPPYKLAKYRGEGKDMSMVDLFNLVHPKVKHASKEQKKAWKELMGGKLVSFDTWETDVSNAKDEKERKKAFEALILEDKMGYMAVLRNLNNFVKYSISEKAQKAVVKKLTDPMEVKRSKQLPFRFVTAYDNVEGNRAYLDAISEAMDLAVANTPELKGKTLIAVDTSGSMSGDPIKKAAIFAATLMKANKNAEVIQFNTRIDPLNISSRLPVIDIAKRIEQDAQGGGTNTNLVFEVAENNKVKYDRIFIISDNESWSGEAWGGGDVQRAYVSYTKTTGANPFVYAIDIQGYGTKDVSGGRVMHLTGWSNRLLDFIGAIERGDSLVDYIENYSFTPKEVNEEED